MFQTKVTFAESRRPSSARRTPPLAARGRAAAHHQQRVRVLADLLKPLCRRNRTCSHDMHACFTRHWAPIPEDQKEWLRGAIVAKREGATAMRCCAPPMRAARSICNCRSGSMRGRSRLLRCRVADVADAAPMPNARIRRL